MRIGIDLMGSDRSPDALFEAVLKAAHQYHDVNFHVFACQDFFDAVGNRYSSPSPPLDSSLNIEFHIAKEVISMQDDPITAIRQKKNASLTLALRLLKKRLLDGFVTAGNTGALIAGSTLHLPLLPGIKRPALLASLPTASGLVTVIDVGGSVSCKATHLVQFALMGAAYQKSLMSSHRPKVGLLNIGVESKKGTSEVRQAYQMLKEISERTELSPFQFIGNVEGGDVFQGQADVLVTNGFTGNVLLKTSEGMFFLIEQELRTILKDFSEEQRLLVMQSLAKRFDYEEYHGAIVCGVDCVVVKCHGSSSARGFLKGIQSAVSLVQNQFISKIKNNLF